MNGNFLITFSDPYQQKKIQASKVFKKCALSLFNRMLWLFVILGTCFSMVVKFRSKLGNHLTLWVLSFLSLVHLGTYATYSKAIYISIVG